MPRRHPPLSIESADPVPIERIDPAPTATTLTNADVEAMLRLVADACDPTRPLTIPERRERLVGNVVNLVEADVWIWAIGQTRSDCPHDGPGFTFLDGGWRSESERMEFVRICMEKETAGEINRYTARAFEDMRLLTWMRSDLWALDQWHASPIYRDYSAAGFEDYLLSIYPMPNYYYSVIGLHRRQGRQGFSERERTILHMIWQQVEWLHRQELDVPVGSAVIELTIRERQVLMLLLAGKARKDAAGILELSEHTIGDHVKAIYRKLEVSSRGELLARFMPNRAQIAE